MKKYIQYIIASILFVFTFSINCFASNWYQIDKKLWIDLDSIKSENGNILVWQKKLNDGTWEKDRNKYVWYTLGLFRYDCATRKSDIAEINAYYLNNKPLFPQYANTSDDIFWTNIPPDSDEDKVYHYICK